MKGNVLAFKNPEDKTSCNVINPLKAENNQRLGGGIQKGLLQYSVYVASVVRRRGTPLEELCRQ